jgi:DNA-binding NtrC family response regulator
VFGFGVNSARLDPDHGGQHMEKVCLIVDDEPVIRKYLMAILQQEGYQTLEANNGPQAFRLIQKLDGDLNLVVSDVRMPGDMDGMDLAYAIRTSFPTIPVILISGYAGGACVQRSGAEFQFIEKPFTPATIMTAVRNVIESSGVEPTSK